MNYMYWIIDGSKIQIVIGGVVKSAFMTFSIRGICHVSELLAIKNNTRSNEHRNRKNRSYYRAKQISRRSF